MLNRSDRSIFLFLAPGEREREREKLPDGICQQSMVSQLSVPKAARVVQPSRSKLSTHLKKKKMKKKWKKTIVFFIIIISFSTLTFTFFFFEIQFWFRYWNFFFKEALFKSLIYWLLRANISVLVQLIKKNWVPKSHFYS